MAVFVKKVPVPTLENQEVIQSASEIWERAAYSGSLCIITPSQSPSKLWGIFLGTLFMRSQLFQTENTGEEWQCVLRSWLS